LSNAVYSGIWRWTTKTTDANTAGQIGNNASGWDATQLNINQQRDDNTDVTVRLASIQMGDEIRVQQKTDGTKWATYEVVSSGVDQGTWWQFPVRFLEYGTVPPNNSTEVTVSLSVTADNPYVSKSGDTMTGPLILNANPTAPLEAVPKQYTDARTPKIVSSTTAPSSPAVGDVWIDTN
jgi:hypothetical protein